MEAEQGAGDGSRGLRLVADSFYRGPIAREIDAWSRAHGGLLRHGDLATHVTRVEEPVAIEYRGHRVFKCGPRTQGPALLESLQPLEGFDLKRMGHNRADSIHVTVEALKLALADRDFDYADPLFADVPLAELLSHRSPALRRALIDPRHASHEQRPGDPRSGKALLAEAEARRGLGGPTWDTTTYLVADARGNVVAATLNGWSGVVAGRTGVWLGTRLQSFNIWEGHLNCIEPGKRPRITLTPTLVLKDDAPALAVSVAGGDNQDQMILQLLINQIDFGLPPAASVIAPRFLAGHFLGSFRQKAPDLDSLKLSPGFDEATIAELKARGHRVSFGRPPLACNPCVLSIDRPSGQLRTAGYPQARRHAGAY